MLVKHLGSREKALFNHLEKLNKKQANYHHLYLALSQTGKFDEEKILKVMREKGFSERQVRDYANYLFSQLLRVLGYLSRNTQSDLLHLFESIELLVELGNTQHALKLIAQAKAKAREIEQFGLEFDLIWKELKILDSDSFREFRFSKRNQLNNEISNCSKRQEEISSLSRLYDDALYLLDERWRLSSQELQLQEPAEATLQRIRSNLLLQNEKSLNSLSAKVLFHSIWCIIYLRERDFGNLIASAQGSIKLISSNPFLAQSYHNLLLKNQFKVVIASIQLGNILQGREYFEGMTYSEAGNTQISHERTFYIVYAGVFLAYETDNYELGNTIINSYLNTPEEINSLHLYHQNLLSVFLSNFFFVQGEFSQANKWIRLILNDNYAKVPFRTELLARIIEVLILIGLKNKSLAQSKILASQKRISRRKIHVKGWTKLKKILMGICDIHSNTEVKEFAKLLLASQLDEEVIQLCKPFDIKLFLKSTIEGITMAETKEKD